MIEPLVEILRDSQMSPDCVLAEDDEGAGSGCTRIEGLGKGLVLRPTPPAGQSLNTWLFPLFDPRTGDVTSLCDFILFCPREHGARLVVLLCELKTKNTRGHLGQIRSGMILAEYVINAVLLHHRPTMVPRIEYRGVLFSTSAAPPKGASGPGRGVDYAVDPVTRLPWTHQRAGMRYRLDALCKELARPRTHRSDPLARD